MNDRDIRNYEMVLRERDQCRAGVLFPASTLGGKPFAKISA
jgi:hypothetical protein